MMNEIIPLLVECIDRVNLGDTIRIPEMYEEYLPHKMKIFLLDSL